MVYGLLFVGCSLYYYLVTVLKGRQPQTTNHKPQTQKY